MEDTIENNRLIAEFMGAKMYKLFASYNQPPNPLKSHIVKHMTYDYEKMQYHESWDWLMSVVEKINNLDNTFVRIHKDVVYVDLDPRYRSTHIVGTGKNRYSNLIEALYTAVVEFIKWYNQQPK